MLKKSINIFLFLIVFITDAVKALGISVDKVEDFAMGRGQNNAKGKLNARFSEDRVKTSSNKASRQNGDDLESFFSMGSRSNSVPKCGTITPVRTTNILKTAICKMSFDFSNLLLHALF